MKVTLLVTSIWLLTAVASAQAAGYQCTSNGTTYYSYQPCPNSGLVYHGPVNTPTRYEAPMPKIGTAPDFQDRLSPRCSSLNDAIRTGPARGLRSDTLSDMRQEYQQKCSDEENEVRMRIRSEMNDKKKQQQELQQLEVKSKERTAVQQQQCDESRRIIHAKSKRTDLTDGEKTDFQRFVDNHQRRCG